jgi:hypothetical protein
MKWRQTKLNQNQMTFQIRMTQNETQYCQKKIPYLNDVIAITTKIKPNKVSVPKYKSGDITKVE